MEISDQLRCLFSSTIDEQDKSYRIEILENEIQLNNLQEGQPIVSLSCYHCQRVT